MSKEKDDIQKVSRPDAKKRKRVPDFGRPERRELGHNDGKNG